MCFENPSLYFVCQILNILYVQEVLTHFIPYDMKWVKTSLTDSKAPPACCPYRPKSRAAVICHAIVLCVQKVCRNVRLGLKTKLGASKHLCYQLKA